MWTLVSVSCALSAVLVLASSLVVMSAMSSLVVYVVVVAAGLVAGLVAGSVGVLAAVSAWVSVAELARASLQARGSPCSRKR